jgi:YbgC/YbaW family acyl-CoA thioester hydrolase
VFEIAIRVDYIDTDAMGVVHHSSYCRWLERARIGWLDLIQQSYKSMESEGMGLPVRELEIKYKVPLRFHDQALVAVSQVDLARHTLEIHYKITSLDRKRTFALARTKHALVKMEHKVDDEGQKVLSLVEIPESWRSKWQQLNVQKS